MKVRIEDFDTARQMKGKADLVVEDQTPDQVVQSRWTVCAGTAQKRCCHLLGRLFR
jgi:hypothetical protein